MLHLASGRSYKQTAQGTGHVLEAASALKGVLPPEGSLGKRTGLDGKRDHQ